MNCATLLAASALLLSSAAHAFEVKITDIKPGGKIGEEHVFNSFGCSGQNQSPEIKWSGAPKGTKAFAVTVYDPDAPTGSGWWHWVVFNLPADTTSLPADAGNTEGSKLPQGAVQSRTDFGKAGYGGPCPPPGKPHRYIFTVYALKDTVPLDKDASGAMVGFYLHQLMLAKAEITAKYSR
jgi:Raf kinase inhibitor-like YbhB/YbcL family protein